MIETKGLGAGSYPEPPYKDFTKHNIKITLECECEVDFPMDWTREDIKQVVEQNLTDYINRPKDIDYEIEID